jgi:hypothetical protein
MVGYQTRCKNRLQANPDRLALIWYVGYNAAVERTEEKPKGWWTMATRTKDDCQAADHKPMLTNHKVAW